ncbi:hypothetical protein B0T24DRAFT_596106 [Lasiosphaeria ovina]|uniref:Protein kinase domain-containing protein n=1 Tax=Lasiosphaeria ovina TaxID=92902 RepID=A0AAE0K493_9PEZI|nr:hypothetical protein B0T24DRAFT_596106 [Lasiosphaeria ovina]
MPAPKYWNWKRGKALPKDRLGTSFTLWANTSDPGATFFSRHYADLRDFAEWKISDLDDILYQGACALDFLHDKGQTHGSVGPHTVRVQSKDPLIIKVAEHGVARLLVPLFEENMRNPKHRPFIRPEAKTFLEPEDDVYALIMTVVYVLYGSLPPCNFNETLEAYKKSTIERLRASAANHGTPPERRTHLNMDTMPKGSRVRLNSSSNQPLKPRRVYHDWVEGGGRGSEISLIGELGDSLYFWSYEFTTS